MYYTSVFLIQNARKLYFLSSFYFFFFPCINPSFHTSCFSRLSLVYLYILVQWFILCLINLILIFFLLKPQMTRGPLLFWFKYKAGVILTSVVKNQISYGSRAPELHLDPFCADNTLIFFSKFKGKLTHRDSGKELSSICHNWVE